MKIRPLNCIKIIYKKGRILNTLYEQAIEACIQSDKELCQNLLKRIERVKKL